MQSPFTPFKVAIVVVVYVVLCVIILCFSPPDYAAVPTSAQQEAHAGFTIVDQEWQDAARSRAVPVRILVPEGSGPFPLILFSHGLGGTRESGKQWGEYWASHGYLVVHVQHVGSDDSIWRGKPILQRLSGLQGATTPAETLARVKDVHFVLDEATRLRAADDPIFTKADLTRIGMSGHSFGAVTTQIVAGERVGTLSTSLRDPRVKAAIAFSPSAHEVDHLDQHFGGIDMPFFSMTGTRDGHVLPGIGVDPENRVLPFAHMPPGEKYLLVIKDADHMLFNGKVGLRDQMSAVANKEATEAIELSAIELIKTASLAFWDAELKGDAKAHAWLVNGGMTTQLADAGRFQMR